MPPRGWKQHQRLRGHEAHIHTIVWSPDARKLASFDERNRLVTWDVVTGKPVHAHKYTIPIGAVAWSPKGDALAVATDEDPLQSAGFHDDSYYETDIEDRLRNVQEADLSDFDDIDIDEPLYVKIFDTDSGLQIGGLHFRSKAQVPNSLVWPTQDRLYAAAIDGVSIWQPEDGHYLGRLEDPSHEKFLCITSNAAGSQVAAAGRNGDIVVWHNDEVRHVFESDLSELIAIGLSPGFDRLAVGCEAGVVDVWTFGADEPDVRSLEAHTDGVISVSFSSDGKLLATGSLDGSIKLWDTSDWVLLSETPRRRGRIRASASFSPQGSLLAGSIDNDQAVRTWNIDPSVLAARRKGPNTVHYTNAKVVLLGDSGVGKTGLGLVLSGQSFRATESTHQRNVWLLPGVSGGSQEGERREVFLWDLAGQPGYRLLHQLHLADVAVALVVFDARNEVDPLAGVRHWARALTQATRQAKREQRAITRILVAARLDRGAAKVSDAELRSVRREFAFDHYVTTSAKEGEGIATLNREIEKSIDWESQPKVSSTRLFDAIRAFLLQKRDTELVLTTEADLRRAFIETGAASSAEVDPEFRVCVDRAQARGLIRRFSFGDLILLRPEILDAYAAAVLHAAGADPDGLGEIGEAAVRTAQFPIPKDSRLANPETESLLLIATIEDLLRHEVALREDSGQGPYLVFPTQTRHHVPLPHQLLPWCHFRFEGPVQHVWATLIVRLAHSEVFVREAVGQDLAVFRAGQQNFALHLITPEEGEGKIRLMTDVSEPDHLKELLERFVEAHLRRRAVWNSVLHSRLVACAACGFIIPDALIDALGDVDGLNCPKCTARIELAGADLDASESARAEVRTLEQTADDERHRLAARTAVEGKEAVREFDVFIAYNSLDYTPVAALSDRLRDSGLNPWLDQDRIPPGRWVQDVIQEAIGKSASAIICIGTSGLGKWQVVELRAFLEECVAQDIPVIPTLLPNAKFPKEAAFIRALGYVKFNKSISEEEPLRRLMWGITGKR